MNIEFSSTEYNKPIHDSSNGKIEKEDCLLKYKSSFSNFQNYKIYLMSFEPWDKA